jgi:hypothetical protein
VTAFSEMAFAETVTLHSRTATSTDGLGVDVYTDTSTQASGAVFDPGGTTEALATGDQVTQSPRFIWVGVIPTLKAVDAITRADGSKWEVTGNPLQFTSPFNGQQVLQVDVRQVTG